MKDYPNIIMWALPAFMAVGLFEFLTHRIKRNGEHRGYGAADTATSAVMGVGSLILDFMWRVPIAAAYSAIYALTPLRIDLTLISLFPILLTQDFFYYWSHRSHHTIRLLWASHVAHHSSVYFNFSTAVRQSWTGVTAWVFYIPMVIMGVHPGALAFCSSVNLVYQFCIHTEKIDKLPRIIEAIFNTPSHHRVHHASQSGYLDRNFGGIFIIWDRAFRSFALEVEPCQYGITKNIGTYNPLRVATHEYVSIARDVSAAKNWRQRLGYIIYSPGWSPSEVEFNTPRNLDEKST
ncbi:sterol desaturase family protein [Streptomyces sp. 3211]|uniref:sterol desaturase family protein n=1 Tax=Streptomyces sp. 3211 TaxID=1964449 RepID=UPI0009A4D460|nr:sterol desaturase family protein [Streptomyces sp. 3211]